MTEPFKWYSKVWLSTGQHIAVHHQTSNSGGAYAQEQQSSCVHVWQGLPLPMAQYGTLSERKSQPECGHQPMLLQLVDMCEGSLQSLHDPGEKAVVEEAEHIHAG